MEKMKMPLPWILSLGAVVSACGPSYLAPPVTPQLVKLSPAPMNLLARGYEIHQTKCAKCHAFENPADYGIDDLKFEIMPEMARRSKLNSEDEKAVLAYLLAARSMSPKLKPGD